MFHLSKNSFSLKPLIVFKIGGKNERYEYGSPGAAAVQ